METLCLSCHCFLLSIIYCSCSEKIFLVIPSSTSYELLASCSLTIVGYIQLHDAIPKSAPARLQSTSSVTFCTVRDLPNYYLINDCKLPSTHSDRHGAAVEWLIDQSPPYSSLSRTGRCQNLERRGATATSPSV